MNKPRRLLLAGSIALASCGGGGGGGSPTPEPAPTPRAVADTALTNEATSIAINVLANDTAVSAGSLAVSNTPTHGVATLSGTSISYAPNAGFSGTDTFDYSVNGTNGAALSATVTVTVNATPTAVEDTYEIVEDTPTELDILANDNDPEDSFDTSVNGITIVSAPAGEVNVSNGFVTYTPPPDFVGDDEFTYRVRDTNGAVSNTVSVTVTMTAVTATSLTVTELTVPQSDYAARNHAELNATVFSSALQDLAIPPNTVSYLLMLSGNDVASSDGLLLTNLEDPDGVLPGVLQRRYIVCDAPLCSAYVPRIPGLETTRGTWQFRLGTTEDDLSGISFGDVKLRLAARTGPPPDLDAAFPATIKVRPFVTAPTSSVSDVQVEAILGAFRNIATTNGLNLEMSDFERLDPRFAEVSSDFTDATTAELVRKGAADSVNIFFLESFTGPGDRIGISPGIPGTLGVKSNLNGVLINATITQDQDPNIYTRSTAEFAFHEMGHLLGLYHTTEADFETHDVLADTPECNTPGSVVECPDGLNMMYWTVDFSMEKEPLTDDQKAVLFHSPIATP